jgi:DNA-binding transcriptional regulator YiaG
MDPRMNSTDTGRITRPSKRLCRACHAPSTAVPSVIEATREVNGCRFVATLPARVCSSCNHVEVDRVAESKFLEQIARVLADSGAASGGAFRIMRKAIGMRGTELARLLAVAPETVSRWETEKRGIDRATVAVLASLVHERAEQRRTTLDSLQRLGKPVTLPSTLRIDVDAPLPARCA